MRRILRRIWTAIKVFFAALFHEERAEQFAAILKGEPVERPAVPEAKPKAAAKPKPKPKPPARNDALTLLATLQREARLVDFLQESLEGYSDAQIGAAARDVHRDCGKVLQRLFAVAPLSGEEEGAEVEVPAGFDPGRYRLVGALSGDPPYRGRLVHRGWEATQCRLPEWTGSQSAARVVAPVEVEL